VNVFEEIKTKLNLVEVLSDYVQVKNIGSTYKCVCPFHKDKNPSLVVSPEKGLWHCFGCGAGGDMFKFVMDFENISKKEALERLGKKAGVDLKQFQTAKIENKTAEGEAAEIEAESDFSTGLKYLDWVKNVYHKVLLKILNDRQNPVTKYCLERNLSQETLETFQIGYAPGGDFILKLAQKHGLNLQVLAEIGALKIKNEDQKTTKEKPIYKDKFTDRLMIPVFSKTAQAVGFTGRILPYDKSGRPKYLNSSQSAWFNKSEIWYGWHLNQKNIRQRKQVIIVEGNMDVIASYQNGLNYVLASQGTSFTSAQLKNLKYLTSKIILAFDNDEAGISSGKKFFKEATSLGFLVQKLLIPKTSKDLDQWLQTMEDKKAIESHLKTKDYVDYIISEEEAGLKSGELQTQKQAILQVLDLLVAADQLTAEHYLNKLSLITKKSLQALNSEFKKLKLNRTTFSLVVQKGSEIETKKDSTLLVTWQNYVAEKSQEVGSNEEKIHLENMFLLLQIILPELKIYTSLASYLETEKDILILISSENKKKEMDYEKLTQILLQKINLHYNDFLLDEKLTRIYLSLYNQ